MSATIDARGLSCPQPVLMTLEEIQKGSQEELVVLVDNNVARENVSRALASKNFTVEEISEESGIYRLEACAKK